MQVSACAPECATYALVMSTIGRQPPSWRAVLPSLPAEWWDGPNRLLVNIDGSPAPLELPDEAAVPLMYCLSPEWHPAAPETARPAVTAEQVRAALVDAVWRRMTRNVPADLMARYLAQEATLLEVAEACGVQDAEAFDKLRAWAPLHQFEQWVDPAQPNAPQFPAAMLDCRLKPDEWVAYPLLERQYASMLVGEGGGGKSTWAIGLALHIAAERDNFGPIELRVGGPVLYVHCDERADKMAKRVKAACKFYEIPKQVPLVTWEPKHASFEHDEEGQPSTFMRDLDATIKRLKPVVVMFDPLVNFEAGDENSANTMAVVARQIIDRAVAYNFAALIVHHPPKGQVDVMDPNAARGSSALPGSMRAVAFFDTKKDGTRALYQSKHSYSRSGLPVTTWRFESVVLDATGDDYGVMVPCSIADPTNWEHREALLQLVEAGQDGEGKPWSCSAKGRKEYRLDVAVDERWGDGTAAQVLPALEAAGLLVRRMVKPERTSYEGWVLGGAPLPVQQ